MVRLLRGFRLPASAMVAVLAAVLAAATHFARSEGSSGQQSYLQLNMCGNACNHGGLQVVRKYVRDEIAAQIRTIADVLRGLGRTRPVMLGGDLNTVPTDARMDPLYSAPDGRVGSGADNLEEADSLAGRSRAASDPTFSSSKIDYIFLSTGGWSGVRASVFDAVGGLSAHSALWAVGLPRLLLTGPG